MIKEVEEIIRKIKAKEIVGADDTAIASAKALSILAKRSDAKTAREFRNEVKDNADRLIGARPSSSSLRNCVSSVIREVEAADDVKIVNLRNLVEASADRFVERINEAKSRIGEIGSKRIRDGDVILTHGSSTTVLAILKKIAEEGKRVHVFVTEARPEFEGLKMAQKISQLGLPVTLIVDSAVRVFINEIDHVLIGAEAIAVNGAVISRVGSAVVAAIAQEARVRTLVAAGTYKLSPETVVGELVEIEEGDRKQIFDSDVLAKMKNIDVRNPLYDVTPPQYIDAIITEKGIVPPQGAYLMLRQMMEG
jgi:ribose 1,5-bisphosphate isomerase